MLSNRLLQEKTFDNLMQEARMQIPLYSKEWTNFNPSEPAITLLETVSAYTILQQEYIGRMPESVQEKLFELAGFVRKKGKGARVLIEARNVEEPVLIPAGQKFQIGNMNFETNREHKLFGNRILGVYCKQDEKLIDFSYVLDPDIPLKASVFSEKPKVGMELYFVIDNLGEAGDEIICYADLEEPYMRNPIEGSQPFAKIQWQCFTKRGFVDMRQKDYTEGFLQSGELRLRIPKEGAVVYDELPEKGYVIKGILQKADYDIPPKLHNFYGFLFEVWQKDTHSVCYTFQKQDVIEVYSDILEEGYWQVFCREEEEDSYRLYEDAGNLPVTGRYYQVERLGFGRYQFMFDKNKYGYSAGSYINGIKLVAYNEEMMQQYYLGELYGYEKQRIDLPIKNLIREGFAVIARRVNEAGEPVYDFIKPDSQKENEFLYTLYEAEGWIQIEEAMDFVGAKLFLCGCASTQGEEGNVRAGNKFMPAGYQTQISFHNPAKGSSGRLLESLSEVRQRFIEDVNEHYTAVEVSDYERIVKTTPGLCIHKVKAVMNKEKNQVQIAVKPYSKENYPKLSQLYQNAIYERLEGRRLLTTKIELMQPVYVEVSVQGTIYAKSHYEGSREQIEKVVREELDYINSNKNFGQRLHFDELFHKIEALDCVEFVYELTANSKNNQFAVKVGLDIQPADHCLLIPGEINLEINTVE